MKFRVTFALVVLMLAGAAYQAADTGRKHINLPKPAGFANLPFSDAASAGEEAKLAMDAIQQTLAAAGMSMDDLVSVQVHCSDLGLYDTFNKVYASYFHGEFPARAFLGAAKLLRDARFEVLGTAVKQTK